MPIRYRYKPGRVFLLRARVEPDAADPTGFVVVPPGSQDSNFLAALARANALVTLPADADRVAAGEVRMACWLSSYRP